VGEEARARQQLAAHILAGLAFAPGGAATGAAVTTAAADAGGIHIWLTLPDYWRSGQLAQAALAEGLSVTASDAFDGSAHPPNAIRISLGSIRDRARLAGALRKLSQLLARIPPAPRELAV
jgi:DNA-binding transcriptional MocR family regulator